MAQEMGGDEAIQATNDEAVTGKRCAVQLGYWRDPYLQYFCRHAERKPPEMNRGHYARTQAIKELVVKVIKMSGGRCQVVNLGAGFDTLYWRLKDEGFTVVNFTEVDFPSVTARKCFSIKKSKLLLQGISNGDGDIRISSSEMHSPNYHLVSADIRNFTELSQKLKEAEMDLSIPTVFVAECVLVYLETYHSEALLQWVADHFPTAVFISYEQVNMNDRFGSVMIENLKQRGCHLAGVAVCDDLGSQERRFLSTGWATANAIDMMQVYSRLSTDEIHRVERLEFLDERELMEQLFKHYCIAIATKDSHQLGLARLEL